jgi:anti-sigma regulatory factor (Ser/Thr protein kinase)
MTVRPQEATASSELPTAEGYLHELGIYASDEEFRDLVCPFGLGALEVGEPVVLACDPHKMELLQHWLPDAPSISYVTDTSPYATPAKALVAWRRVIEDHLAAGAPRVRIAGNVPHPGYGRSYAGWDRYEAAVNRALGDLPVWASCLYDARIAPADVLETATRLHHHVFDRNGTHRANDSFEPVGRLADFLTPPLDPLESTAPTVELIDPTPLAARVAVRHVTERLSADQRHGLVLATSEAVTNALLHGIPPVRLRIWLGVGRVVINVHDEGNGPINPLAGLCSSEDESEAGRGLSLAHQLDIDVALIAAGDGFTVRLGAGNSP